MSELNLSNIFRLDFVNTKANHEVRNNLNFFICFTNNFYCFINIKQYFCKTVKQMQFFCFFGSVKVCSAFNALYTKCYPFFKQGFYAQNFWHSVYKHIKITRIRVFKRCKLKQLSHKFIRIYATLQVNCNFKSVDTCFITDI